MKTLLSALVLTTTLTTAALAGPVALTEAQMDTVTAGGGGMGVDPSVYGGGAGVDPSVYGNGAGVDPSVYGSGAGVDPGDALTAFGVKGSAGQGGDSNIVSPTNN